MKCPLNHQYLDSIFDAWWKDSIKSLDTLMERVATAAYRKALEECRTECHEVARALSDNVNQSQGAGECRRIISEKLAALTPETEQQ